MLLTLVSHWPRPCYSITRGCCYNKSSLPQSHCWVSVWEAAPKAGAPAPIWPLALCSITHKLAFQNGVGRRVLHTCTSDSHMFVRNYTNKERSQNPYPDFPSGSILENQYVITAGY